MEEPKSKAKRGAKTAAAAQEDKITLLPLSELHDFPNHPFKVRDDEAMQETAESIRQYGVLVPATPTSGAAARPLLHSTAPASSATSTTTAAWAGASADWARRDCASSVRGCPPPTCAPAIWCSSKAPMTPPARPMLAYMWATI